ncbi:hypothetical protein [Nocardia sp. NPDC049526]|uniref:hypothetical protein n=1 Tax=Nocardia sp. NPDC049526 TaxID=3364316 RepID=UPI00378E45AE
MTTTAQPTSPDESLPATADSGLTVASIRASISPVRRRLGDRAKAREQTRDYAFAEVRALADAGIALAGIAKQDGGAGGSLRVVTDVVIDVARADSSVAQALRSTS